MGSLAERSPRSALRVRYTVFANSRFVVETVGPLTDSRRPAICSSCRTLEYGRTRRGLGKCGSWGVKAVAVEDAWAGAEEIAEGGSWSGLIWRRDGARRRRTRGGLFRFWSGAARHGSVSIPVATIDGFSPETSRARVTLREIHDGVLARAQTIRAASRPATGAPVASTRNTISAWCIGMAVASSRITKSGAPVARCALSHRSAPNAYPLVRRAVDDCVVNVDDILVQRMRGSLREMAKERLRGSTWLRCPRCRSRRRRQREFQAAFAVKIHRHEAA